jgi:nucleoside-diphosphate-sugar epimerase
LKLELRQLLNFINVTDKRFIMKILVTGSSGFIGSNLVEQLKKNYEIVTFDIKDDKKEDVRNLDSLLKKLHGCGAIVHLAALCIDSESNEKPLEYFSTNFSGTLNVLEAARMLGIKKIINASSAGVGNRTPYSLSKLQAEQLCELFAKNHGIQVASLRFFNVYGLENEKGVIYEFIKRLKDSKPLIVNNDGNQVRDYVHVRDVVKTIKKLLETGFAHGVYEVGSGKGVSVKQLIRMLEKISGKKPKVERRKLNYEEVRYSVSKKTIVKNPIRLEDGLKEIWNSTVY